MINWIKRKIEENRQAEQAAARAAQLKAAQLRAEKEKELRELRLITIQNKMYLTSSINVYTSNVNNIKGRNGAETKRRKEFLTQKIKWMTEKLEEETSMVSYYDQQLAVL